MDIRKYNVYFNLHTISGIIVSAVLYVIFFAGSLSFFKAEISAWQQGVSAVSGTADEGQYARLLDSLENEYNLLGRNITIYRYRGSSHAFVGVEPSVDTIRNDLAAKQGYFYYDFAQHEQKTYTDVYDLGEFLYRLHFLAQLNEAVPVNMGYPFGYIVAGLVAFLFLFALITGLLLHWDKLVSNFYQFRPWAKAKAAWTDLHTVLGVIGFPYQFMFAFTGVILIINTVFVGPFGTLVYPDDTAKVYQDLGFDTPVESIYAGEPLLVKPDVQALLDSVDAQWPGAFVKRITIKNFGDCNMRVAVAAEADHRRSFAGDGFMVIDGASGEVLSEKSPYGQPTYTDYLRAGIYRLHYGDFGGYAIKIIYFILGISGCFVIASGIIIWLVARDKNNVEPRKRRFNRWLANWFMAICLSMLPVTALTFVVVKLMPAVDQTVIYRVYFWSWLVFVVYYTVRKSIARTTRETLVIGSLLALLVPVANGLASGKWWWQTYAAGEVDMLLVDLVWMALGVCGLAAYRLMRSLRQRWATTASSIRITNR